MQTNDINILITDDIEDNRLILKTICKKLGNINIFEAVNGLEATQIVDSNEIDIVLMDVMMPVMDGFEATKIIKSVENPPYLLIITAVADKETEEKFTALGIDGYVRKPIDKEGLKSRLDGLRNSCLIKKGIKTGMSAKKPLSKQVDKCRNFKTYFYIENEEDAMNLGLWLTDYKARYDANITFAFEDSLAAIYKICKICIQKQSHLTIVIEEDFENIYITFIPSNSLNCMEVGEKLSDSVKQNLLCETTLLYLTVVISEDVKSIVTGALKAKEDVIKEKISVSEEDVKILRRSHTEKVSAKEFVEDYLESASMDEIYDLRDIEDKWKELISDVAHAKTKESLTALVEGAIDEYARVVNRIYEFSAIGYALSSLCAFLRSVDEQRMTEMAPKLAMLLEHILDDLSNWRNTIFVAKDTPDIHYLDSSLLSSCMQIDAILSEKIASSDDDEDELELF